jgi:hypothetical protein
MHMAAAFTPKASIKPSSASKKAAAAAAILPRKARLIRIDPELARLAVVLHVAPPFRLWAIGRELTRSGNGSGLIDRDSLYKEMLRREVIHTRRHFNRLLAGGEGVFWNVDEERIFLRSWKHVACALVAEAKRLKVGDLESNRPGVRQVTIDPAGTLEEFEANIYAGWQFYRTATFIARATLSVLFNRDKITIRRWEKQWLKGRIKIRYNFIQCADPIEICDFLPGHDEHPRPDARGYPAKVWYKNKFHIEKRMRWQISSTYMIAGVGIHQPRGQSNKIRRHVNALVGIPAFERWGGLRLRVVDAKKLKQIRHKQPEKLPVLVWRGEDWLECGIFEISVTGYAVTNPKERVLPRRLRKYIRKRERKARTERKNWDQLFVFKAGGGGT